MAFTCVAYGCSTVTELEQHSKTGCFMYGLKICFCSYHGNLV